MKKIDALFVAALAMTAVVTISAVKADTQYTAEPQEPACAATTAATTEETTEPTETEAPITEPPVALYDVPLSEELQLHIISEAEAHGIDPAIIMAMAFRESTYNASAIGDGGNSFGLLQVQLRWHRERMERLGCDDLLDPFQNVTVAIDYLAEQLDRYGGDLAKGLTAYNQGHYKGVVSGYAKTILAKAEELWDKQ